MVRLHGARQCLGRCSTRQARDGLMTDNTPWGFVEWLDRFEHADRRPVRNAILYFLFPDNLERSVSSKYRLEIVDVPPELQAGARNNGT